MMMRTWITRAATALLLCAPGTVLAANALIVHDGTVGLEASVVTNLSGKLTAGTYTVTTNVGVPAGSLAGYKQIWDVRFNNTTPLSGTDITAYLTFLQGGGSLFVMGENTGFATRNNSIVSLVSSVGGGSITVTNPASNIQTVQPPFTGPNAVTTVTFLAAAAVQVPGSGTYVTKDGSSFGAALVWPPGSLASAAAGTLIVVFDVNFLDPGSGADANAQAFTSNLIAYLAAPGPVGNLPIPTLSTWAIVALGLALAAVAVKVLSGGARAA